jgi:hypothetical protein
VLHFPTWIGWARSWLNELSRVRSRERDLLMRDVCRRKDAQALALCVTEATSASTDDCCLRLIQYSRRFHRSSSERMGRRSTARYRGGA